MSNKDKFDKIESQFKEIYEKFAASISTVVRSLPAELRLDAIRNASPNQTALQKIYDIAKQNEDYETCEAVKQFCLENEIEISN